MKTTYKLFGLTEQNVITEAYLGYDGVKTNKEMHVNRVHIADFDFELEALNYIENCDEFEHGIEIIKTINKL